MRGPRGVRFIAWVLTALLGILVFWLLGFLVEDIESIRGPDYATVEVGHVDQSLLKKWQEKTAQIAELDRQIEAKRAQQRLAGDSSENLQRTVAQLVELQKLSIQKDLPLSEVEKGNLAASLGGFLEAQKKYQELNQEIAELASRRASLDEECRSAAQQLDGQRSSARAEYGKLARAHRLRLALYELLMLVPLLLAAGYLLVTQRSSIYFPFWLACGAAVLVRVGLVVHECFPSGLFKYVLLVGLLGVVAFVLAHLVRMAAFPRPEWLARQYRDAYQRFVCPVCEYPIRTGPRRFLYWTRRTAHRVLPAGDSAEKPEPYTCPSCGTRLFEECASCRQIRHSLLPHCEHCGAAKEGD